MKHKILSLLVLLLTAATGAWAQTQITQGFEDGMGDWTMNHCHSSTGISSQYGGYEGSNMFRFYYSENYPQYLISPEIDAAGGGTMSFYYARYSSNYTESFKVGYSTTTSEPSAFTWGNEQTVSNGYGLEFFNFTYDFPAGTKYVAIAFTSNNQFYFFIDDITIDIEESVLEVTTDAEPEGAPFTEATFTMPANNVKVTYAMARDMAVDVNAEANADSYYVIKRNNVFDYLYPDDVTFTVTDVIDAENPVVMTAGTDYTTTMQKKDEDGENWTDVTELSIGTFRYVITGKGGYTGTIYSDPIVLKEAYEVEVAAKSYITYYQKDNLTLEADEENAIIYTVASIEGDKAYLSDPIDAAPKETPLLIYNSSDDDQTFYLLSVPNEPNLALTVAPEFMGTLANKNMPGSDDETTYYVCNRHDFVRVDDAGTLYANRCWIQIGEGEEPQARKLQIVFSDLTGVNEVKEVREVNDDSFYDLNGRKVNQPKRKGVYIQNGRKVIVK